MPPVSTIKKDLEVARVKLAQSGRTTCATRLGPIEYAEFGEGPPVIWVHGVFGGCDQGRAMAHALAGKGFRFLAVSRFGYLGSPIPSVSTPAAQADLYAALLDELRIENAALVGASAGGASSLQFALRHSDRCSALVLWSTVVPGNAAPPLPLRFLLARFFGCDIIQWTTMSYAPWLMQTIMGVPRRVRASMSQEEQAWLSSVMWSFLPGSDRVAGVMNDVCVTNPDLNTGYALATINVPTLIVHAEDDPLPAFALAQDLAAQVPGAVFVPVKAGGHLLLGHHEVIRGTISEFLKAHADRGSPRVQA